MLEIKRCVKNDAQNLIYLIANEGRIPEEIYRNNPRVRHPLFFEGGRKWSDKGGGSFESKYSGGRKTEI